MSNPPLSVIIPVYNRERYIAGAMQSILRQSFSDFELLIIDDASTDRGPEIIKACGDSRIRFISSNRNLGIPAIRNLGLGLAKGEFVAFLDSDDYASPGRLQKQLSFLAARRDCAMVGCWEKSMDEFGMVYGGIKRRPLTAQDVRAHSLFECGISGRAMMGRTAILREARFRESFPVSEDFDLCARLSRDYQLCNLPEVLIYHRKHAGNIGREKALLMKQKAMEIIAVQLGDLAIRFSNDDLERHYLLRRMAKAAFTPDDEFLEWTEFWCRGLLAANVIRRLYPLPALSQKIGSLWSHACFRAATTRPVSALQRFWKSPLRSDAWGGLQHVLALRFARQRIFERRS